MKKQMAVSLIAIILSVVAIAMVIDFKHQAAGAALVNRTLIDLNTDFDAIDQKELDRLRQLMGELNEHTHTALMKVSDASFKNAADGLEDRKKIMAYILKQEEHIFGELERMRNNIEILNERDVEMVEWIKRRPQ